jgi:FG-GAP-like repeat
VNAEENAPSPYAPFFISGPVTDVFVSASASAGAPAYEVEASVPKTFDSLTINATAGNDTVAIGNTQTNVAGTGPGGEVFVNASAAPSGVSGNNIIDVDATSSTLTVSPDGADVVTIGLNGNNQVIDGQPVHDPTDTNIGMQEIHGAVFIEGAQDRATLVLDNRDDGTARTVTVNSTTVTGLSPAMIEYFRVGAITIKDGSLNPGDTFNVQSTEGPLLGTGQSLATITTIDSNGADTINVNDSTGMLDIKGLLKISGIDQHKAVLILNDEADSTIHNNIQVSAVQVIGLAPAFINIDPGALGVLDIDGPSPSLLTTGVPNAGSVMNVGSTPAGMTTNIFCDAHDTVIVGGNFTGSQASLNNLSGVQGSLFVTCGLNIPIVTLILNDQGDATARTATFVGVSATTISSVSGLSPAQITSLFCPNVTINGGTGGDTFNVQSTSAPMFGASPVPTFTTTTINSFGADTVNVGDATGVQDIQGKLVVNGVLDDETLNLNDQADTTARTVKVTNGSITGLAPAEIDYSNCASVNINNASAVDIINVLSTAQALFLVRTTTMTINSSNAGVTVNVGDANGVQDIKGPLVINKFAPADTLNINDQGDTSSRTATITSTAVTGLAPATITYGLHALATLNVTGDSSTGGNIFNVLSTPPPLILTTIFGRFVEPTTTTLNSKGPDTINVGDATGVQDIQGQLDINGSSTTHVVLNDQPDATAQTVTLTNTGVTGLAPSLPLYANVIDYTNLASLTILGGLGGNTLDVASTAFGTTTNLVGDGNSAITVGNSSNSCGGIQGTLDLESQSALDHNTITVNDTGGPRTTAAAISTLGTNPSDFLINMDPWGTITGLSPAAINFEYPDTGSVTVNLPTAFFLDTITGQKFGSSITVVPVAGQQYFIHGNAALPPPGNALTVSSVNGTVVDHPTGTFAGNFTFLNSAAQVVVYTGIQRPSPIGLLVASTDAGISPEVKVYTAQTGILLLDLHPFPLTFQGGVRVAVGDLNGDGIPDIITAEGPGSVSNGDSQVQVFDGITGHRLSGPLGLFDPFPGFHGGLYVASADINSDGYADLIVGEGAGGQGWVKIYSGQNGSLLAQFQPFGAFTGGVRLAAGPVTSNGDVDVVTAAGPGGPPKVEVFDGPNLVQGNYTPVASFNAFNASFTGGVYVATGLIHDEGKPPAEIIVGEGAGGEPRVSVFDGTGAQLQSFLAFEPGFKGGVRVAAADVTGDGRSDIITAEGPGPGSLPEVRAFDGVSLQQIDDFFAFPANLRTGLFVAGGGKWGIFNPSATNLSSHSNLPSMDPSSTLLVTPIAFGRAGAFTQTFNENPNLPPLQRTPDSTTATYPAASTLKVSSENPTRELASLWEDNTGWLDSLADDLLLNQRRQSGWLDF